MARDCQMEGEAAGRPTWCGGECDKRTRLIDRDSYAQRCHQCWAWPSRGTRFHQLLPQHRLCGGCNQLIYSWDSNLCGDHQPLAINAGGHRLHRPELPGAGAIAARARQDLKDHHHDT